MTEGVFPKVDGDILYASEVNMMAKQIWQIYTGTGLNASRGGAPAGTTTNTLELDAVTTNYSTALNYYKVSVTQTSATSGGSTGGGNYNGTVNITYAIKETAGAYGGETTLLSVGNSSSSSGDASAIITLTAGQKANGFQVRLTSNVTNTANTDPLYGSASLSVSQILSELKGV